LELFETELFYVNIKSAILNTNPETIQDTPPQDTLQH